MKNYLLITLGHNSSAIFVDNSSGEQKIIGYEQERLSRLKADSQFPIDAINEIEYNVGYNKMKGCTVLISHWFSTKWLSNPHIDVHGNCKYMDENACQKIDSYKPEQVKFVNSEFTHHDAHAYSALAFYNYHNGNEQIHVVNGPSYILVADGFGNDEEVLSLYVSHKKDKKPRLLHRVYGYQYSLGLFYQYATAFVGMKENQDEYKFLGYEAHISDILNVEQLSTIDNHINRTVDYFTCNWANTTEPNAQNEAIIDMSKLRKARKYWYSQFSNVCDAIHVDDHSSFNARCAIAYFIQQTCEQALAQFVKRYDIENLIVVGGTFYNVKLNNALLSKIKGIFCAMPLAGDQGAAIGMYEAENKEHAPQFKFNTLAWGKRRLYNFEKYANSVDVHYYKLRNDDRTSFKLLADCIAARVSDGALVNVVFGNMEFGPRALGNTSTIFLPTVDNVADNNHMNHRNEVMPCAPICTEDNARILFDCEELDRVIGSDRFMICTHNYCRPYSKQYGGVMHSKTLDTEFTGRPQIVRNGSFMYQVLKQVERTTDTVCLVNTSFNVHGNPIVFDTKDIMDNFNFQKEHAKEPHNLELFVIEIV